jgi:hypothetical protein
MFMWLQGRRWVINFTTVAAPLYGTANHQKNGYETFTADNNAGLLAATHQWHQPGKPAGNRPHCGAPRFG